MFRYHKGASYCTEAEEIAVGFQEFRWIGMWRFNFFHVVSAFVASPSLLGEPALPEGCQMIDDKTCLFCVTK
jgi:hypothetical protein